MANIIKDLNINAESGKPILNESIENLKTHLDNNSKEEQQLLQYLKAMEEECQKSIPHRVLAAKNNVNCLLLQILEQQLELEESKRNTEVLEATLKTLNSLYNKQPDIFDATGLALAKRLLDTCKDSETIVCLTLQWLQKCCIMHEMNRQNIINADIIQYLKPFVAKEKKKALKEMLAVCRYLVLDDDIRVEFGCAHEHARQLAAEFIIEFTNLLAEFDDTGLLADLLLTIGTLAVRQEFCTVVDEAGGIKLVLQVMVSESICLVGMSTIVQSPNCVYIAIIFRL